MTELKEKITRPFAFLKISAITLAAHCQATQADTQIKACQRAAIFPTLIKIVILLTKKYNHEKN
jgi:hypothetical protein